MAVSIKPPRKPYKQEKLLATLAAIARRIVLRFFPTNQTDSLGRATEVEDKETDDNQTLTRYIVVYTRYEYEVFSCEEGNEVETLMQIKGPFSILEYQIVVAENFQKAVTKALPDEWIKWDPLEAEPH